MTRLAAGLFSLAVLAMTSSPARAEGPLKVGDKAPDFTLEASDGKTYKLSDFKGKKGVVIAWYPKAFTGGCTAECKSFQEKNSELAALGVAYFTASVDKNSENTKFAESLGVKYPILSDPEKSTAKAFGILNARGMANRVTFYIDKDGIIKHVDTKVNTKQAGPDVIKKVEELGLNK